MNQTQSEPTAQEHKSGNEFMDVFHKRFAKAYGRKPTWPQVNVQNAHRTAKDRPFDELEAVVEKYFTTEFWFTNGGRSFAQMLKHYDEIVSELPDSKPEVSAAEMERRAAVARAVT